MLGIVFRPGEYRMSSAPNETTNETTNDTINATINDDSSGITSPMRRSFDIDDGEEVGLNPILASKDAGDEINYHELRSKRDSH